jgi:aminopeptidase N
MKRLLLFVALSGFGMPSAAQRLPQTVVPDSYKLVFAPDFSNNTFEGEETIQVRLQEASSAIVLNAAEIEFHEVTVTSLSKTEQAKVLLDQDRQTATFSLAKPLTAGPATLHIRYTGMLNDQLRGFYLGKDDQGRKYAATQLEDTDARRAFPCFDEPAYKATFDLTVVADEGLTAISNGRILSDTPGPGHKHTVHFATSPKMSSYLVALVVGKFEYVQGSADGIPIRVYASPGKKALSQFALEAAEYNLHFYDTYFGIKYPYGKLDLVGLTDFSAGAMENTGCITFREVLLLLDEKAAAISTQKIVAAVIAHEMAHQWFGDLVTMKWWDDKWLNEGFATWMSSKPVAAWKPGWNIAADNANAMVNSLDLDSLVNTHPIHQQADTPEQIIALDDAITYGKAAAVLRMLESYLGPETFRAGVNAYLKRHSYANAASADFWDAQTEVSKKPVDKIMPTWVEQAGVPLLKIKSKCAGNSQTISVEQERYFYDRKRMEQDTSELWQIPVCTRPGRSNGDTQAQCELAVKKEEAFALAGCTQWDYVNANAMGFYRSGYDSPTVLEMAKDFESALNPPERIMLLSDVWASVRIGREPIGDYLTLAEGLKRDRNDAVLDQLLPHLIYIGEHLTDGSDAELFASWVRQLLAPIAEEVGWAPKPGESETLDNLRASLLAALAEAGHDPQARAMARKLSEQALTDQSSVNRQIADDALRAAAYDGDESLYEKILGDLKAAKDPEIYFRDFSVLSRFRDPKLVERTLQYALSSQVRSQDSPYLIYQVMQNPADQRQTWNFVQAHWPEIEKLGGAFAGGVVVRGTSAFCDSGLRDEVSAFFGAHRATAAERSLKQSLERIDYCTDLKMTQQDQLASWLKQKKGPVNGFDLGTFTPRTSEPSHSICKLEYLRFEEQLVQLRVEFLILDGHLQDIEGAVRVNRFFVRPVRGGERIKDVANRHDFCLDRDFRGPQFVRIARAV